MLLNQTPIAVKAETGVRIAPHVSAFYFVATTRFDMNNRRGKLFASIFLKEPGSRMSEVSIDLNIGNGSLQNFPFRPI